MFTDTGLGDTKKSTCCKQTRAIFDTGHGHHDSTPFLLLVIDRSKRMGRDRQQTMTHGKYRLAEYFLRIRVDGMRRAVTEKYEIETAQLNSTPFRPVELVMELGVPD